MTDAILADYLQLAVPLRMHQLRGRDPDQLAQLGQDQADTITAHGDDILYRGRDTRKAVAALVTGLACLALTSPGGVTFAGQHFGPA